MAAQHIASAGAGVYTPAGFAEALKQYGASINPAVKRGLWKGSRITRAVFIARFTSRGVGKGIFGKKKSGAYKIVRTRVVGPRGNVFILALELRGFAALQETGGRTKKHPIAAKNAKALKLKVPSIGVVLRRVVEHPGSRIAADPSGPRAFEASSSRIQAEIDKALSLFKHNGVRIASSKAA